MIETGSRVLRGDHVRDVVAEPALVEQTDRRDAQALAEHLARPTTSNEPGTLPPTSDQWPFDWLKPMILSVGEDRPDQADSGKCVPPA